jgi:hypothetical protein
LPLEFKLALNEIIDGFGLEEVHSSIENGPACKLASFCRSEAEVGELLEDCQDNCFGAVEVELEEILPRVASVLFEVDHEATVDESFLGTEEGTKHHFSGFYFELGENGLFCRQGMQKKAGFWPCERKDFVRVMTGDADYLDYG